MILKLPSPAALLAFAILAAPAPAQAGFEWIPPPPGSAGSAPGSSGAVGVVEYGQPPAIDAWPQQGTEPGEINGAPLATVAVEQQPIMPFAVSELPPASTVMAPPAMPPGDYSIAEGFGRDIPLALVMQQIVPKEYAYSFDPGVEPGMPVSWDGGRPWNVVLDEALRKAGLSLAIVDKTVWVRQSAPGETPMASLAPLPFPEPMAGTPTLPPGDAASATPLALTEAVPPSADMTPVAGAYTPEQLMAIGAGTEGYEPSYPRRQPQPVQEAAAPVLPLAAMDGAAATPEPETLSVTETVSTGPVWQAQKGKSLRSTLDEWCARAGVKLFWDNAGDFPLPADLRVEGEFPDAVGMILSSYENAPAQPAGTLHANPDGGTPVLIIN